MKCNKEPFQAHLTKQKSRDSVFQQASLACLEHKAAILKVYFGGFSFSRLWNSRVSLCVAGHASARVANTWPWAGALF